MGYAGIDKITEIRGFKDKFKTKNPKAASYLMILLVLVGLVVTQLPVFFKDGKIENFKYIASHEFVIVILAIAMSLLIYAMLDKFMDASKEKDILNQLNTKLHLVKSMIETKGLETIVTSEEITKVENNSDEIIMIVDNLFLDLPFEYKDSFEGMLDDFGTFFNPVHENIKAGKQYTYYLKYDNNTHNAINLHMKAHFYALEKKYKDIKEPIFILIPSNEFSFFSDIYIYKDNFRNSKSAYEWLPTLTKDKTLFYLQFDNNQTNKLEHILITNKKKYGITLGSTLQKSEEYIVNASYISKIEKESKQIQIITDDLTDDLKDGIFFNDVETNLSQNKRYTYFLPDNKDIRYKIEQYKIDHNLFDKNDKVVFTCIPDNMFFFFNNVYIYDNDRAFEFMPASNMYFIYDNKQLEKLLFNIKSLEISLSKEV